MASPVKRVHAPTPKHMAKTPVTPKASPSKGTSVSNYSRQAVQGSVVTGRKSVVDRVKEYDNVERVKTPPSFRQNFVKTISKKSKREATPPPMTFQEYLQEARHPLATGRATTPMHPPEKFGSYPQYKPDDTEYIIKSTRSLKVRTPTPGPSRNGFNTSLLAPRTREDNAKEAAMIQAIRKELHSSRTGDVTADGLMDSGIDSGLVVDSRTPAHSVALDPCTSMTIDPRASVQATSRASVVDPRCSARPLSAHPRTASRCQSRSLSRSQSRPKSSQLELVREKKTVGFLDENEYYRYLTYLEEKYGDECSRPSSHFNSWRRTTNNVVKKTSRPVQPIRRGWQTPTPESPGKVNLNMDCPDNSDMTISLRVRNTPTATVY